MTNQELEQRLATAITHAAPNDLEGVLSRCETRKGNVIQMTQKNGNNKKNKPLIRTFAAACLTLVLIGGGSLVYQQNYAVASIVSLDVNPSIELKVNRQETVLDCQPLNEDAKNVLADMNQGSDLKGAKLEVAVNAVVGALLRTGHLDSISSAILISVEDHDQSRAAKLQQELTSAVDGVLQNGASGAAVLSQTVEKSAALEKQARTYNISTGKAALINRALSLNTSLQFDALAALSVEELKDLLESGVPGMPIGKDEAVRLAKEYAGISDESLIAVEVDSELDEAQPHYEVEVYTPAKFSCRVDAYTGEILQGKNNIPAESPVGSAAPSIGEADALSLSTDDFFKKNPELQGTTIQKRRVELDLDDGIIHYDVEFYLSGYEVDYEIDALTGSILSWDTDYKKPLPQTATTETDIGKDRAKAIALSHAKLSESNVSRLRAELDHDNGRLVYEVDFKANGIEYEYTVDGTSGVVLEHEQDRDD